MKKIVIFAVVMVGMISFTSCSKDDGQGVQKGKTAKFTLSAPGLTSEDIVAFVFTGSMNGQVSGTSWKINGITQDNQGVIQIKNELLIGNKTVIVETTKPLDNIIVTFGGSSDNTPYTIKLRAEINGKIENDISDIVNQTYSKSLNY